MHPLRPTYTKHLYQRLNKNSLNIYTPQGQGQLRLLADLQHLAQEQGNNVLVCNMKDYAEHYHGFIQQLAVQIEANNPNIKAEALQTLSNIFSALENSPKKQRQLLFLNNFDALLDSPQLAPHYNVDFFDALNTFNHKGHRLVCITKKPYSQSMIYINGLEQGNSWLNLKKEKLPALTYEQIEQELLQQKYKHYHSGFNLLIETIEAHPQPYQFLQFIYPRLKFSDEKDTLLKDRLAQLQTEFKHDESLSMLKTVFHDSKKTQDFIMATRLYKLPPYLINWLLK
ncbi:MAG: hypothetical protein KAG10_04915 [Methylococcales bacterium]|nr:hypothetical protein [Methylococcales bacterium]